MAPVALNALSGYPLVPGTGDPEYVGASPRTAPTVGSATNVAPNQIGGTGVLNDPRGADHHGPVIVADDDVVNVKTHSR